MAVIAGDDTTAHNTMSNGLAYNYYYNYLDGVASDKCSNKNAKIYLTNLTIVGFDTIYHDYNPTAPATQRCTTVSGLNTYGYIVCDNVQSLTIDQYNSL